MSHYPEIVVDLSFRESYVFVFVKLETNLQGEIMVRYTDKEGDMSQTIEAYKWTAPGDIPINKGVDYHEVE